MARGFEYEEENNQEKKLNKRKVIIMIIIIIIIILLLITSCSCVSDFVGKIGNPYDNSGDHTVEPDTNDKETIRNKYLKFDNDNVEMSLSDTNYKLSYSYEYIIPKNLTCTTSDASIATCYVEKGYVVINPKKEGTVTVTLSGDANDKKYEATATVTITNPKRAIVLSSTSGTIDLSKSKVKMFTFDLIGLIGDINVESSNKGVAEVYVNKDGVVVVTGKRVGTADIRVTLEYNGITYEAIYKLTVINGNQNVVKPNDPGHIDNPSGDIKNSDSLLKVLEPNKGAIEFNPTTFNYKMAFSWWRWHISFTAIPNSDKASVSYIYNGNTVDNLNKLKLNVGDNILKIVVTAEDGSSSVYEVVINRAKSSNNYLKKLETSVGNLNPSFDKQTLHYDMIVGNSVDKITLWATPYKKKATLYYTFNGKNVGSLEDLELKEGVNIVTVTVVAPDGKNVRVYDIKIVREQPVSELDHDSTLKTLNVSKGNTLNFNPMVTGPYLVNVGASVQNVSVTAIPNSDKVKEVQYVLNGKKIENLDNLPLEEGDNKLEITVVAEDGSKTTYTVIINRASKDNSNTLMMITPSKGTLTPEFDANQSSYKVYVGEKDNTITLTVTTTSKKATLSYIYKGEKRENLRDLPLEEGVNQVQILVTSESGITRTYLVDVIKPVSVKDKNNLLASIETEPFVKVEFDPQTKNPIYIAVKENIDKINLKGIPQSNKATVKYLIGTQVFDTLEDIELKLGDNEITIRVTAEDGSSRDYKVIINRSNLYLESLKDSYGKLDKLFKKEVLHYEIELEHKNETITLYPEFKGELQFRICQVDENGKEQNCTNRNNLQDIALIPGKNRVYIDLKNNVEERSYIVDIIRKNKSDENRLEDIFVKDDSTLLLKPDFDSNINEYNINVPYEKKAISLEIKKKDPNSTVKVEYEYNGKQYDTLENLPLNTGENVIKVIVTSESGKKNTYVIHVNRPTRTIEFTKTSYDLFVGKSYTIPYIIWETDVNGNKTNVTNNVEIDSVKALLDTSSKIEIVEKGFIKVDAAVADLGSVGILKVQYDGQEATVNLRFIKEDYYVTTPRKEYTMNYSATDSTLNERQIILNTNLFTGKVTKEFDGNSLVLKSNDGKYIRIDIVEGNHLVKLDYKETNELGPTALSLNLKALNNGDVKLKVTMGAYGNVLDGENQSLEILLHIVRKYTVILDANGGTFNLLTKSYTFLLDNGESVDLKEYDIPYKISNDQCKVYKFLGYSVKKENLTPDSGLEINSQKKVDYVITNLDKDVTYYAIYDENTLEDKEPEKKELWLVDVPLFHNEEYYSQYNEDKVIYPGAKGYYTERLKNESDKTITITNLILKEDTICIPDKGCLNMGYVIRFYPKEDTRATYFIGKENHYEILNKKAFSINDSENYRTMSTNDLLGTRGNSRLNLSTGSKPIVMNPGEEIELLIAWEWAFESGDKQDDILDTLIGEYAGRVKDTLNDRYRFYLGIQFEVEDTCSSH